MRDKKTYFVNELTVYEVVECVEKQDSEDVYYVCDSFDSESEAEKYKSELQKEESEQ